MDGAPDAALPPRLAAPPPRRRYRAPTAAGSPARRRSPPLLAPVVGADADTAHPVGGGRRVSLALTRTRPRCPGEHNRAVTRGGSALPSGCLRVPTSTRRWRVRSDA